MHDNNLNKKIMRRVYTIWFFRKATSALAVEIYVFVGVLSAAFYRISFFDVMRNAFNSSSFSSLSRFFLNNFLLADLLSQILTAGIIIMAISIIITRELPRKQNFI